MSFNLLDIVKGQFNSDLVSKAASFLGENESGVTKALSGIIPSVLSGVVSKATVNETGAGEVLNAAKESHGSGIFSNLGGLLGGGDILNKGADLLKGLLGDKIGGIATAIAGFAGIKSSSATSLMSMAAPAAMSSLGKHAVENNLNAGGFMDLISSQKSTILNALPAGLSSVAGMFGLGKVSDAVSSVAGNAKGAVADTYNYAEKKAKGGMGWFLPLLGLIAAGLLIWWFLLNGKNSCNGSKKGGDGTDTTVVQPAGDNTVVDGNNAVAAVVGKIDTVSGEFVYDLGKMIKLELPNSGGTLEVGENSTEAKLLAFLGDASKTVDTVKGNWFEFTNVKFKTGSSEITEESLTQLKNMVAIAKAYPTAQFKFGGYTDNTGDSVKNVALSQKRADAVAAKVVALGAAKTSFLESKGYGPQWPIGDNGTAEGRAMNRRVAVNVKAK